MKAQSSPLRLGWIKLQTAGILTEIIPSASSWSLTSPNRTLNSSNLKTILHLMTTGSRLVSTLKISKKRGSLMANSRWAPPSYPRQQMNLLRIKRHSSYRKLEIDWVSWWTSLTPTASIPKPSAEVLLSSRGKTLKPKIKILQRDGLRPTSSSRNPLAPLLNLTSISEGRVR